MKRPTEPGDLATTILELLAANRPFAVATVLKADHSTPVIAGAKAVVEADGTNHGTVGGGTVEAETLRQAKRVVQTGNPVVFDFDLAGPGVDEPSAICGGAMRLLVAPSTIASHEDYRRASAARARRERGVWQTMIRPGSELKVEARYIAASELGMNHGFPDAGVLAATLAKETPVLLISPPTAGENQFEVFLEPLIPKPVLLIVGGGHVGQATAAQAALLGFEIVVIEDRPEFAHPNLFPPGSTTRCGAVAEELAAFPVHLDTFIVLVSRGHQLDSIALRACIRRPAAYIGMIGSRRKVPLVRRQFLEQGWATAAEFDRVYAPIGLDLGAITVPEIATSIVAQMIAVRRTGSASRMPL
jgi:xanthine dehydrogenase accessory factor